MVELKKQCVDIIENNLQNKTAPSERISTQCDPVCRSEKETKKRREGGEAPTFNGVSVLQKFGLNSSSVMLSNC